VNGFKWTDALRGFNNATPGQSGRRNVVRYDSPTFAGFTGTAAWGDDDIWDVALTYKGEIRDFSIVAKVGYGESNNPGGDNNGDPTSSTYVINGTPCIAGSKTANSQPGFDCRWGGAAATIMHQPTGLYVYGGWGKQSVDTNNATTAAKLVEPDSSMWFLQAGIEQKWLPLGKTTVFGMYRHDDVGSNAGKTVSSNVTFWQGGVVQSVDAAAMNLYVIYQHADGDVTGNPAIEGSSGAPLGKTSLESFQEVIAGAMIQF
jgi:predicted porin